ncbi:hypothetical protein HYV31_01525 [candidate division WWE3 bacterium]|nr:hypothetical protein [candidate division WWE3 bacterium]
MKNLYYAPKTKIKLKRALPKSPDMCKLSTYANAVNHYGFENKYGYKLTPEKLLAKINRNRKIRGLKKLDSTKNVIPTKDLDLVVNKLKLVKITSVSGNYLKNPKTWLEIIKNGGLIAPYHQLVYSDMLLMKSKIVKEIENGNRFGYKKFISFVDSILKFYGPFDNGHIDLVLDLKKQNGRFKLILANLVSVDNKHPIAIDWHLFSRYLFWDWYVYKLIDSKSQIPNKKSINKLMTDGKLKYKNFNFMWGSALIFSPISSTFSV